MLKEKFITINKITESTIEERFTDIEENQVAEDREYISVCTKVKKLYFKIKSLLPKEHCELMTEFDDLTTYLAYLEARIMYMQGLKDGQALHELMGGAENV